MNASDWIALVSAGIALLAFVAGGRALQLQRAGAADSARQQLDDLVHQLGLALAKINAYAASPRPGSVESPVNNEAGMGEIQTLALQADELVQPAGGLPPADDRWRRRLLEVWNPPSRPPALNWYEAVVLAYSFAQIWDIDRARGYWDRAFNLCTGPGAKVGATAQISTLRFTGAFYYNTNSEGDLGRARDAFDNALEILRPEINGPDLTHDQNCTTRFLQAQQEEQLANLDQAARYLRQAWQWTTEVQAFWRRQRAQSQITLYVASGKDPNRFEPYGGLPPELHEAVTQLLVQWQPPTPVQQLPAAQQQMLAVAWQQGYTAAQQQMVAARSSPMPPLGEPQPSRFDRPPASHGAAPPNPTFP